MEGKRGKFWELVDIDCQYPETAGDVLDGLDCAIVHLIGFTYQDKDGKLTEVTAETISDLQEAVKRFRALMLYGGRMSHKRRVDSLEITFTACNGRIVHEGNHAGATKWDVTLERDGEKLALPFYMGEAFCNRPPTVYEVMSALFQDCAIYENTGEGGDLQAELGDDWEELLELIPKVKALLGADYGFCLWETESFKG